MSISSQLDPILVNKGIVNKKLRFYIKYCQCMSLEFPYTEIPLGQLLHTNKVFPELYLDINVDSHVKWNDQLITLYIDKYYPKYNHLRKILLEQKLNTDFDYNADSLHDFYKDTSKRFHTEVRNGVYLLNSNIDIKNVFNDFNFEWNWTFLTTGINRVNFKDILKYRDLPWIYQYQNYEMTSPELIDIDEEVYDLEPNWQDESDTVYLSYGKFTYQDYVYMFDNKMISISDIFTDYNFYKPPLTIDEIFKLYKKYYYQECKRYDILNCLIHITTHPDFNLETDFHRLMKLTKDDQTKNVIKQNIMYGNRDSSNYYFESRGYRYSLINKVDFNELPIKLYHPFRCNDILMREFS